MSCIRLLSCLLITGLAWSVDLVPVDTNGPVSTTPVVAPLTLEEAQRWQFFSQVVPVREKESVLVDTAEAKNHLLIVHSISYFKASSGQLYAMVNYLRPRPTEK